MTCRASVIDTASRSALGLIAKLTAELEQAREELAEAQDTIENAPCATCEQYLFERDAARADATALRTQLDAEAAAFVADAQKTHLRENRATMEARSARADAEAWKNQCIQNNEELKRALVAMDAARNERDKANAAVDRLTGAVAAHEAQWAEAADLVGLTGDAEPVEILTEIAMMAEWKVKGRERTVQEFSEPTLSAGTGPVAVPTPRTHAHEDATVVVNNTLYKWHPELNRIEVNGVWHSIPDTTRMCRVCRGDSSNDGQTPHSCHGGEELQTLVQKIENTSTGDLRGLQKIVAQHSRDIPDLLEDTRTLRARIARLERLFTPEGDGKTVIL